MRASLILMTAVLLSGCPSTDTGPVACDPACPASSTCTDGTCVPNEVPDSGGPPDLLPPQCQPACSGGTPVCLGTRCVACVQDDQCAKGNVCLKNICTPGCADDSRCPANAGKCCGGQCVDATSDVANCGGCGMACSQMHASATCSGGACKLGSCNPGWADCNMNPADGCEGNTHVDPMNCTKCGMACTLANAVNGCSDGCYIKACLFGYDDCNGDPTDGCEKSVLTDPKNCGACGTSCSGIPHAQAGCTNGACQLSKCDLGYADCDHDPANGCEVVTSTDVKNCGGCGVVCPNNQICKGGGCTCQQCNIPNASAKCDQNNMCIFDKCNPGFADCNNNVGDGCEVNLNLDAKNCSACGMACPNGQVCGSVVCAVCGVDCWGASGCLTDAGRCIQFTCRAGNSGANFCNGCKGWKDVTYDQWLKGGYCADVIKAYRKSDQNKTHCGQVGACCASSGACGGGDNAWHFFDTNSQQNYYTGPSLGTPNDVNCVNWNNVDNSGYTRLTVCEH